MLKSLLASTIKRGHWQSAWQLLAGVPKTTVMTLSNQDHNTRLFQK